MYGVENTFSGISKEGFIGIIIFIILGGLLDILLILQYNKKYQEVKKEEKAFLLEKYPELSKEDLIYRRLMTEAYLKIYGGVNDSKGKKQKLNMKFAILTGGIATSFLMLKNIPGACFFLFLCFFFGMKMLLVAPEDDQFHDFWVDYLDKNPDNFLKVVLLPDELLEKYDQLKGLWKGSKLYHLLYAIVSLLLLGVVNIISNVQKAMETANLQGTMEPANLEGAKNVLVLLGLICLIVEIVFIKKYNNQLKVLNSEVNKELDVQFPNLSEKDKKFRSANVNTYIAVYNHFKKPYGIKRVYDVWVITIGLGLALGFILSEKYLLGFIFLSLAIANYFFSFLTSYLTVDKDLPAFKENYLKEHPDNPIQLQNSSEETKKMYKKIQPLRNVFLGLPFVYFSIVALTLIVISVVNFL